MIKASQQGKDEENNRYRDLEDTHSDMDDVICELLVKLGYSDIAQFFIKQPKWYA
jgi:hypothetical protein